MNNFRSILGVVGDVNGDDDDDDEYSGDHSFKFEAHDGDSDTSDFGGNHINNNAQCQCIRLALGWWQWWTQFSTATELQNWFVK